MGERAKTWLGTALLAFVLASAAVEQLTSGKFPVPPLIADLAKIAIPALFVADSIDAAARIATRRRNTNAPPGPDGDQT